jgi:hypothetical protein
LVELSDEQRRELFALLDAENFKMSGLNSKGTLTDA